MLGLVEELKGIPANVYDLIASRTDTFSTVLPKA